MMRMNGNMAASACYYIPRTTLINAWLVEFDSERPEEMMLIERGRRSMEAIDMNAGW